jgi:hypothetical protein
MRLLNVPLTKFSINLMSCLLGILWWSIASEAHKAYQTFTIPLCFYNMEKKMVQAPDTLSITLSGKKSQLRALNRSDVAAHINAAILPKKTSVLVLKKEHLLLPQTINLVSYSPSNPLITVQSDT